MILLKCVLNDFKNLLENKQNIKLKQKSILEDEEVYAQTPVNYTKDYHFYIFGIYKGE